MKKITKILFAAGGTLLLSGGVANYLLATQQPPTPQEELTLANLEAMAVDPDIDGSGSWVNGPGHDVKCNRCGSVHNHCKGRNDNRCEQTSCL